MNNLIWHEAVVVVKKTEKCKKELTTYSDSDKYAEKKNHGSCKNFHKLKKQKRKNKLIKITLEKRKREKKNRTKQKGKTGYYILHTWGTISLL